MKWLNLLFNQKKIKVITSFIAFFISLVLTGLYRSYAIRKSIIDIPVYRSSHTVSMPLGGGIVIAITWFLVVFFLFIRKEIDHTLFFALLCGLPVSVIGFADDLVSISPKVRLSVQAASAALALFFLGGINSIDIGFGLISVPIILSILAITGIVWFTNLFNFLDGIDGYLSAEVIFIGFAFFLFFGIVPPVLLAIVTAGFLVWNWQPAKIFMGDVGSTLLGFTIGVFVIYYQNANQSSIVIWLMLTSLFWFDATLTLFRRWRNHEQLFKAHRKHAFQRIVQSGFSHQKTVIFSILINITIMGLVWLALEFPDYLLPVFGINIAYLYVVMKMVDRRFPFKRA